jgi:hypothetical protein
MNKNSEKKHQFIKRAMENPKGVAVEIEILAHSLKKAEKKSTIIRILENLLFIDKSVVYKAVNKTKT